MKNFLIKSTVIIALFLVAFGCFAYFATYSKGISAGELVKFSRKGAIIKTWEGQISQGVSEGQIFQFSVSNSETAVIEDLKSFQGKYVKLHYFERYINLFWLGDTKFFITKVEEDKERNNRRF
ncbi:6-phosphogluconate dehydrogenase [Bizionia argentinensis JUB59]|uniref:6-phosphogluconate dehydrogenase n=1 Tax=Bizionia argentinensis JUB59 TaxID=1046627 RepID=G2EC26_9FLAO|nr:hypothetical protein [Bizionia argentinensis]EGV43995.1 6-phosphogluconate dehydrogenase [Bizionia argentinensis JUB59]